jgi:hypothetical protein
MKLLRSSLFVLFLSVFYSANPQGLPDEGFTSFFYDISTELAVNYRVPSWAKIRTFSYSEEGGTGTIEVRMQRPIPSTTNDRFTLEVYFDSQIAVVFSHGSYEFQTEPVIYPGQSAVVRLADRVVLGYVNSQIIGDIITLTFSSGLIEGGSAYDLCTRYLPGHFDLNNVSGGLGACVSDSRLFLIPNEAAPNYTISMELYFQTTPHPRIPILLPRGREYGCPPTGPNAGNIPKPGDVNGDGRNDWDYPGDKAVPGTNLIVGIFGLDLGPEGAVPVYRNGKWVYDDAYAIGIGRDLNGNGKLDWWEVEAWIGKCPFDGGQNEWYMEKIEGVCIYIVLADIQTMAELDITFIILRLVH